MWEEHKVYKQLEKKDINPTFRKLGSALISLTDGYSLEQTNSTLKLSRQVNQLEQAIFIEKSKGSYHLEVRTSIKPVDFYKRHKFTILNIVPLGEIMNNHRRTSYPLTQEWNDLSIYLATRIKTEVEIYFRRYNTFVKIIDRRREIEPKGFRLDNKYELLIYAAVRTRNKSLLNLYLDKKLSRPVMQIVQGEYVKPGDRQIDEVSFLQRIKALAQTGDFTSIEREIETIGKED